MQPQMRAGARAPVLWPQVVLVSNELLMSLLMLLMTPRVGKLKVAKQLWEER